MRIRPHAALSPLLSLALLCDISPPEPAPAAAIATRSTGARALAGVHSVSQLGATTVAFAAPPVRVQINEPARPRPSMLPANQMRPKVVQAVRPTNGRLAPGWPMLHPREIDAVLRSAAATRRRLPSSIVPSPIVGGARRGGPSGPRSGNVPLGARRALSLANGASGTGINPWWRYQEENVPGGGHVMVNVGTGNLLLQDDDMSVPHKGIALTFRRTYNSQSLHDVNASEGAGFVWS